MEGSLLNVLDDIKLKCRDKVENETKNILKMYKVLKFYISSNLNTSKDVFQQIDPDTLNVIVKMRLIFLMEENALLKIVLYT